MPESNLIGTAWRGTFFLTLTENAPANTGTPTIPRLALTGTIAPPDLPVAWPPASRYPPNPPYFGDGFYQTGNDVMAVRYTPGPRTYTFFRTDALELAAQNLVIGDLMEFWPGGNGLYEFVPGDVGFNTGSYQQKFWCEGWVWTSRGGLNPAS
jgi:hypothetical protein